MNATTDDPLRVLIIEDEETLAEAIGETLENLGYSCALAFSGKEGGKLLETDEFDIVLTDLKLGDSDGLAIVRLVKRFQPDAQVLVVTGRNDVTTAFEAINKEKAAHYILKDDKLYEKIRTAIDQCGEEARKMRQLRDLQRQMDEKFGFDGVVGGGQKMTDVINKLRAYAPTKATVLVLGENGTGKELVARALHVNSPRKAKPFIAMNCAALNENLLDDEMFGHEPHAFTGADKLRKGRFEAANGGTLFLDEIGDMPLTLQAKLLRVLENGEVTRIGANDSIKVDVRLVAATNKDLEAMIKEGKFRQDLYFRLRVGTIRLPSLRERVRDIPLLADHFLKEFAKRHGKKVTAILPAVYRVFERYQWPGNVRELRNIIESMVLQDIDGSLGTEDFPEPEIFHGLDTNTTIGAHALIGRPMAEVERFYCEKALELSGGNREEAAKMLGIGERTLYRNIQKWKLQDGIKKAMLEHPDDTKAMAKSLGITETELKRELKKLGAEEDENSQN